MTYTVITWDDKSYSLSDEDGEDLKEAWIGSDKAFPVELGKDTVSSANIKSIEKFIPSESDMHFPTSETKQLEAGTRCRGQFSIQNEINKIAISKGRGWNKLIRDKKWREEIRQKLRKTDQKWCDHKANDCNCEPRFISYKQRHDYGRLPI